MASPETSDRRLRTPAGRPPAARSRGPRYAANSARSRLRSAPEPRSGRPERGTPPIPLTLRGMRGAPHRPARSSARFFFLLPSMLALLALALFPVVAHAECTTSSCVNYETREVPSVESKPPAETHNSTSGNHKSTKPSNNPKAEGSANSPSESTEEPGTEPSEGSEGESHKQAGGTSGGGNNNPPRGGGESSKPAHNGAKNNDGLGPAEKVADGGGTATPVVHKSETSSGGSSPVVPILIAVIVLAAISIGVVLYRQRKSGQGPDSRVSSSNAS
jgi:hypothetical protein